MDGPWTVDAERIERWSEPERTVHDVMPTQLHPRIFLLVGTADGHLLQHALGLQCVRHPWIDPMQRAIVECVAHVDRKQRLFSHSLDKGPGIGMPGGPVSEMDHDVWKEPCTELDSVCVGVGDIWRCTVAPDRRPAYTLRREGHSGKVRLIMRTSGIPW